MGHAFICGMMARTAAAAAALGLGGGRSGERTVRGRGVLRSSRTGRPSLSESGSFRKNAATLKAAIREGGPAHMSMNAGPTDGHQYI